MSISIQIASLPDRENVVAELWSGDKQVGEVSKEGAQPEIEIYPNPDGGPWWFPVDELLEAIARARGNLM